MEKIIEKQRQQWQTTPVEENKSKDFDYGQETQKIPAQNTAQLAK